MKKIIEFLALLKNQQYNADGILTTHTCDFINDTKFKTAYESAQKSTDMDIDIKWRTHTVLWVANQCLKLDGDFVECGVNKGFFSKAIVTNTEFDKLNKKFYLFDTYEGISGIKDQYSEEEHKLMKVDNWVKEYNLQYDNVKWSFRDYPNVKIVKGVVPEILNSVNIDKVAYLSLDMNCAYPELKAIEFFWSKIVKGGMVILDDYAFDKMYESQRKAMDEFAKQHNVQILTLATGQGLIVK
jgi:hypothetical protein